MDVFEHFNQPKIIYPDISAKPTFADDDEQSYPDMTAFVILKTDNFLLGILNSCTGEFFLRQMSSTIQGVYTRLKTFHAGQFPILEPSDNMREKITVLAHRCLDDWTGLRMISA